MIFEDKTLIIIKNSKGELKSVETTSNRTFKDISIEYRETEAKEKNPRDFLQWGVIKRYFSISDVLK